MDTEAIDHTVEKFPIESRLSMECNRSSFCNWPFQKTQEEKKNNVGKCKKYIYMSTLQWADFLFWCFDCTLNNIAHQGTFKWPTVQRVYFITRLDGSDLKLHVVETDVLGLQQHVHAPAREGVEAMAADLGHPAQRSAAWERRSFCFSCHNAARWLGKANASREPQRWAVPSCWITTINPAIYPIDFISGKAGRERSSRIEIKSSGMGVIVI